MFFNQTYTNTNTKTTNTVNIITFSTCWYIVKSKFSVNTYLEWIQNLLSIVNNFNLVVYTDITSFNTLKPIFANTNANKINMKQIKFIIKPMEEFYGYRYKTDWINNHNNSNISLHKIIDWRLNMLWCEKIHFVNDTIKNKYFATKYYGWCDIGYFRSKENMNAFKYWPNPITLLQNTLVKGVNKIHYGCVQDNPIKYNSLKEDIINYYKNPSSQVLVTNKIEDICFAGGFFILTPQLAAIYARLFDDKLQYYFKNHIFIKDDQQIVMDCIFTNPQLFHTHFSSNWFMFQELLL